jgi:hypothetical protein
MQTRTSLIVLALLALSGCDTALGGRDCGTRACELADAGTSERDAPRIDATAIDAPGSDAGPVDGGADPDAGIPDAGPPPPTGRVLYPTSRLHSPITTDLADGLTAIAATAGRDDHVVSRVGDSITVSTSFLNCFAGSNVVLDGRTELAPTIDHFNAGRVGGANPFTRVSQSATVGWSASAALAGAPAPVDQEIATAHPGYASLMFGSNDVGFRAPDAFASNMLDLTDRLIAAGAIPVLSSIPPRDDSASADARVPLFSAIARGIAQGRGVPFVDFHQALLPLANHGLGGDNLHPNVYSGGGCVFNATGLGYGYDQRNLLVITALDRARRVVAGDAAPDGIVPRMAGMGTVASPFEITGDVFTDLRDTAAIGTSSWPSYPGCSAANEGGPEVLYRLVLDRPATIHAWVLDRGTTDVDVHLLDARGTPDGCLMRNDVEVALAAGPGTYYLSVDSFVDGAGVARVGEYLLVVLLE